MESPVFKQILNRRFNSQKRNISTQKKTLNVNNFLKMKLGKKTIQNGTLGSEKKGSFLSSAKSTFSKIGSTLSRGISGQIIEKPKVSFNSLIKITDDEKDMLTEQIFDINKISQINFFSKFAPYSLFTIFYKDNQDDIIQILSRINFNLFLDTIQLKFNIPRSILLTENIINANYLELSTISSSPSLSTLPINQLLFLLSESLNNDNYKNSKMLSLLGDFYDNIEYLKKQQYINEINKNKISNFINNLIKNIFLNYQNNINFIRYLINKYCNLFGIYLINFNYIDLFNKLSKNIGQSPIEFESKRVMKKSKEIINNDDKPLYGDELSISIKDTSIEPSQKNEVSETEWNKFNQEINKYFVFKTNIIGQAVIEDFNYLNILKLGKNLINLLYLNIFNASNLMKNLLKLLYSYQKNKTPITEESVNKKVIEQMKIIYSKIINKKHIPIRLQVVKNKQSIVDLFNTSSFNLERLINFYTNKSQVLTGYQGGLINNQKLLINVLQNINALYNIKIDDNEKYKLLELNDKLCKFFNIIYELFTSFNLDSTKLNDEKSELIESVVNIFGSNVINIINQNIICNDDKTLKEKVINLLKESECYIDINYLIKYYLLNHTTQQYKESLVKNKLLLSKILTNINDLYKNTNFIQNNKNKLNEKLCKFYNIINNLCNKLIARGLFKNLSMVINIFDIKIIDIFKTDVRCNRELLKNKIIELKTKVLNIIKSPRETPSNIDKLIKFYEENHSLKEYSDNLEPNQKLLYSVFELYNRIYSSTNQKDKKIINILNNKLCKFYYIIQNLYIYYNSNPLYSIYIDPVINIFDNKTIRIINKNIVCDNNNINNNVNTLYELIKVIKYHYIYNKIKNMALDVKLINEDVNFDQVIITIFIYINDFLNLINQQNNDINILENISYKFNDYNIIEIYKLILDNIILLEQEEINELIEIKKMFNIYKKKLILSIRSIIDEIQILIKEFKTYQNYNKDYTMNIISNLNIFMSNLKNIIIIYPELKEKYNEFASEINPIYQKIINSSNNNFVNNKNRLCKNIDIIS